MTPVSVATIWLLATISACIALIATALYILNATIIATIIDAPATALNVVGDVSTAMLTARMTDGKNWMR